MTPNFGSTTMTMDNRSTMLIRVSDLSREWPEGSLFNSYYTKVQERALLLSLDDWLINLVVKCSSIALETRVQSQIGSYQRLKKWYLMSPCLTLSIIRYVTRVKWNNPGNPGVVAIERKLSGHPWQWSPTMLISCKI